MDKFLEKHTLQKLAHKEVENLNWSITSKKIEVVIKILHTLWWKLSNIYMIINTIYFTNIGKKEKQKEPSLSHSIRQVLFSYQNQTKTLHEKKATDRYLFNYRCQNPLQNNSQLYPAKFRRIIYHVQVGSISAMKDWYNRCNTPYQANERQIHDNLSKWRESVDKSQYPFMIKRHSMIWK